MPDTIDKRAEELAREVRHQTRRWEYDEEQECDVGIDEPTLSLEDATALIAAALRKERQEAADRLCDQCDIIEKGEDSCSRPFSCWQRHAILKED